MKNNTSFIDLLFILTTCIMALFVMSFLLIAENKKKQDSNLKTKAEYVIIVTWPKLWDDDVDTWLMDPQNKKCWYFNKDTGSAHLDRDDLGERGDKVKDINGNIIEYPYNQEITTIRSVIEGEWVLNLNLYRKTSKGIIPVNVKMDKLNPTIKTIIFKEVYLKTYRDEITVARFYMNKKGDIIDLNSIPKHIVEKPEGPP